MLLSFNELRQQSKTSIFMIQLKRLKVKSVVFLLSQTAAIKRKTKSAAKYT